MYNASSESISFSQAHILVVGDIMLDRYLWGEVKRISPEGPVPVVRLKESSETLGGAGNVASNLSALGCTTTLIGVRGDDASGQRLARIVAKRSINGRLLVDAARPTVTKTRVIANSQQLFRLDEEDTALLSDVLQQQLLEHIDACLVHCRAVVLSDYGKGMLQSPGLCQAIIARCRSRSLPIVVDPKGDDWERYRNASCITPNTAEMQQIAGQTATVVPDDLLPSAEETAAALNLRHLLLTCGSKGMALVTPGQPSERIHARALEVFDVSGAGDTVVAVLAAGLARGMSTAAAARMANLAAGIVVGKLGTQPVTLAELQLALQIEDPRRHSPLPAKMLRLDAAVMQVQAWRSAGERVVFTNGCFDLLHPGHVNLLHQARVLGDRLVVGLNSDVSVKRLKGLGRPILNERDRCAILSALASVDLVLLFDEDTPLELIQTLKPDVLVKGADYRREDVVGGDLVESYGGEVRLVPLVEGYSTTDITRRVLSAGTRG